MEKMLPSSIATALCKVQQNEIDVEEAVRRQTADLDAVAAMPSSRHISKTCCMEIAEMTVHRKIVVRNPLLELSPRRIESPPDRAVLRRSH